MRLPFLAALLLAACAADPVLLPDAAASADAGAMVCTPGAQVACACVGGAPGAQVCAADGRSLGACACPDAGGGTDVGMVVDVGFDVPRVDAGRDAGSVDVGLDSGGASNPGRRFQSCRTLGAPCADGSTCLRAMSRGTNSSPEGLCSYTCDHDSDCARYQPDSGDAPTAVCSGTMTVPLHCEIGCALGSCPASTQCFTVPNSLKRDPTRNYPQCQPQSDP